MTTSTTTIKLKNRVTSWNILVNVQRTPASVSDLRKARWMEHVPVSDVMKVERVKVWTTHPEYPPQAQPPYDTAWEVTFRSGAIGYVADYNDGHSEIQALVVNGVGYLHGLAVWRKHGRIVGTGVTWFRTNLSKRGKPLNPDRAPRCCALEIYTRAAGKPFGEN